MTESGGTNDDSWAIPTELSSKIHTAYMAAKPCSKCLSSEPDGTPLSQPKSSTPDSDLPKAFTAPVNEVSSIIHTSSSSLPSQAVIVTSNDQSSASPPPTVTPDMAESSESSTDPHKRGRRFLYRLAPLLKLTLPSRVERRRTQSVFNLQAEAAPTGKSGSYLHQNNQTSPRSGGIRTTACEKQWIRHGTLVHHCISFMEDKSLTGTGGSFASATQRFTIGLALRNADLYVQRLWHELQLRVHGNHFEKELGHRVSLAKKVIAQLVSFDLSQTDDARQAEQSIYSESSSVLPASYVERIRIVHLAVSNILEKADRVEQAWSSEARMTADIVDWILPEVWSRLTCLRQWSGRLLIIQRGLSQLCAFLHNCSSGTISCSIHSRPQRGSNLHGTEAFSEEITRCPLLAAGANEAWTRLCRQFLLDSWYMCALPNHEQSLAQRGVSSDELTSTPGGYPAALIRLDRLVDRLLTEIRGNRLGGRSPLPEPSRGKATQTCSPLHRNDPTMKAVSSTLFQRIVKPCLPARALCVKCSSENVISSVNSDRPLLREPHPSGVSVDSSSIQSSQCAASPNRHVIRAQNNESTAIESSTLTWWQTLRKKLQQRSPASYASVVKRRSWNGCISPLELNIPHSDGVQTPHIAGLPVKWEICSPSHSVSPHGRSASSTPSPPSSPHRSDSEHSPVSTTSKSVSDSSSSSSSSLNSFPQTGCALAESPTSTTSEGTSYWSVDLPDIHPLGKSPSSSAGPVGNVQQDVGLELGLPPLVFLWLCLARIPFCVTRESVAMKLEQYADRVHGCTAPNRLSLIHLVHELRSLMITALRVTRAYRRRLVIALKLNTVAQIPPVPLLSTRHIPSWPLTETQSDDSDGESGLYPSSHHMVPLSKPLWFLEATGQVRQFLDDATSPNSLVKLLEAYSDCLVRLLDIECSTPKGSPSDLRGLVEREWDHIRRVYRQLHRCRGGIHYASLSDLGIIDQRRQTVELTFVRLCKNIIGFLSEHFAPQLGVWARGAATDPFKDNSLVIASSETRRAVRKHISMFVHRMAKQLIFKPRKPPPACFLPMPDMSGSDVRYVRPGKPHGLINRIPAKNGFGGSVEYLLVCPGLPVKLWNGLAYNFMDVRGVPAYQSRSNHVRRSWYALQWLVALCCHSAFSSTPSMHQDHHVSGLPLSLTTWLISDYPHAAWSLLRDSSDRLRRWLAFSCLNPSVLGCFKVGDGHLSVDQDSPGTRACSFQMAPIMADLYNSVHSLRRNLCDLSARLQGSLLVMESHLRSYLDNTESAPRAFSEASALGSAIHCAERPSPTRFGSVSDGRDSVTLYALGVDPVQRAFSVVFGFHKTLIRLMSTAPVRTPFYSEERDPSGERGSLHTRLVHLGVRLLRSWADYVTSRYPRGRGRIPRWANDACHFAYRLCQPRSVKFLDAQKVSSLEATLNALIPHLVGERAAGESPTPVLHPHLVDHDPFSRCHSAAVPGRIHSPPCPTVLRPRRVHSSHGFLPSQKLSFHHQQSYKSTKSPRKAMRVPILEETPYSSDIRRRKTLTLLAELEARRDSQLQSLCLIGRTRLEQHHTPTKSIIPSPRAVLHSGACGGNTPKDVEYFPTHLGRRHFPYNWNRGRLIGIGATGKVFQAFNLQTQEMMAVKEIQLDHDFDDQSPASCPETLERLNSFRRECDLLSNLSHPALVRFLGADEQTPRVLRLFTELCSAGTLADVVKDSPSESLIRCYASDLASAIVYLHERGIVHRDIKPSNVFLVAHPAPIECARPNAVQNGGAGPQDQARRFLHMPLLKLGDFSHSLRLHSFSSNAHGIAGTVCYMAPEVCRSSKSGYGKPCDIWSYCCVLLELITGRRPWYHVPEMHGVFYKLCCDETPLLPKVKPEPGDADGSMPLTPSVYTSAEAFTLLRAGLTPDPSKRPTAPELFQFCFVQSPLSECR
ncbi:mitogen-activated protein kinase kinase kinase 4 [Clonorchis sinensis]|uniref:Mitogen-activated protein kinase kinase kinase 4 n=1 Tax=Clonorchis sinensis TaxID=79923 RepID=G7YH45_CLOSI|nr:mitogen-activated protein kinase kinase kinase 4 [Clonorchis sinensis]